MLHQQDDIVTSESGPKCTTTRDECAFPDLVATLGCTWNIAVPRSRAFYSSEAGFLPPLPFIALNLSSSSPLPPPTFPASPPSTFFLAPISCSLASLASSVIVFPPLSSLSACPCRLRCSFSRLNPCPPVSACLCRCAFSLAARILVRV